MKQIISKEYNDRLSGYYDTNKGGRAENQDMPFYGDTRYGFLVMVCDGMGGGPSGAVASQLAVKGISVYLENYENKDNKPKTEILNDAIVNTHKSLMHFMEVHPEHKGMGTTLAAILIDKDSVAIAHVGDSRVYQFREGVKIFQTQDHSLVGDLVRKRTLTDEQARLSAQSNIITNAIGTNGMCNPEITERPFMRGDRFMLCSDGVWEMFPQKELIKKASKKGALSDLFNTFMTDIENEGKAAGGNHDNYTLMLLDLNFDSKKKDEMWMRKKKVLYIIAVCILSLLLIIFFFTRNCSTSSTENNVNQEKLLEQKNKTIDSLKNLLNSSSKKERKETPISENNKNSSSKESVSDSSAMSVAILVKELKEDRDHFKANNNEDINNNEYKEKREQQIKELEKLLSDKRHKQLYQKAIKALKDRKYTKVINMLDTIK